MNAVEVAKIVRPWVRLIALIVAVGTIVIFLLGAAVWVTMEIDPAPHWVVSARTTIYFLVGVERTNYRNYGAYLSSKELRMHGFKGVDCDYAYCYTVGVLPSGFVIRAKPAPFRRFILYVTRTKWPTFYADQTGIIHQSTGPEPASATSPTVPPGGGW
jgi:hypothetical protein